MISVFTGYTQTVNSVISRDSILKLFQNNNAFEVFYELGSKKYTLDFKALYNDTVLKPYFLKWLDRKEYFLFTLEKEKSKIIDNSKLINEEILYLLIKRNIKNAFDSINNNPELYKLYSDSAVNQFINRFTKYKDPEKFEVPQDAVVFHSFLAYPESYSIIKKWWTESKLDVNSKYFLPLVRLGDHEAETAFDKRIVEFLKTNGNSEELMSIYSDLTYLNNSYAISKMIDLFKIDKNFVMLSDGDEGNPFNCIIFNFLLSEFNYYGIETTKLKETKKPCKELSKLVPEIRKAALQLIDNHKSEEAYWKENISYSW